MKKTIIALFALAGAAVAGTSGWTVSQSDATHITYTTTQTGTFSLASPIADGESFTLTMTFYAESNPFLQGGGLSFLASDAGKGTELYNINGGNDEFRFYVRPGDSIFNFSTRWYN